MVIEGDGRGSVKKVDRFEKKATLNRMLWVYEPNVLVIYAT